MLAHALVMQYQYSDRKEIKDPPLKQRQISQACRLAGGQADPITPAYPHLLEKIFS